MYRFIKQLLICCFITSCAQQIPPDGGSKDDKAPVVKGSKPTNQSTNFTSEKIIIEFDEYIQVKEAKNIIISPQTKNKSTIEANGKNLEIKFNKGDLDTNTTYVISLTNSISDIHEGKLLETYNYIFSTGQNIDSNLIEGIVINSASSKPSNNFSVALFNNKTNKDSTIYKKTISYITRSNEDGSFRLTNLPLDTFEIIAFKDENNNNQIDKTEEIGFNDQLIITPHKDKIKLRSFKQNLYETEKLLDTIMINENIYKFIIYDHNNLKINTLNSKNYTKKIKHPEKYDTLIVFNKLTKDNISNIFSIEINGNTYDTIKVIGNKRLKTKKQEYNELKIKPQTKPSETITIESSTPIKSINKSFILLKRDTVNITNFQIDSVDPFKYSVVYNFDELLNYQIDIEDSAIENIYNQYNKKVTQQIIVPKKDNYGGIIITNSTRKDSSIILQIVDSKDINNVIFSERFIQEKFDIKYITPGTYLIRLVRDENLNNKWDEGNIHKKQQPEFIKYLKDELSIKAYWDIEIKIEDGDIIFN